MNVQNQQFLIHTVAILNYIYIPEKKKKRHPLLKVA